MPGTRARAAPGPRTSSRSRCSWLCPFSVGRRVRRQDDPVRQAVPRAVPITQLLHRGEVLLEELAPVAFVGEVDVRLDRRAGDRLAIERGPVEQRDRVPLEL